LKAGQVNGLEASGAGNSRYAKSACSSPAGMQAGATGAATSACYQSATNLAAATEGIKIC
jgi:hypothetical protein